MNSFLEQLENETSTKTEDLLEEYYSSRLLAGDSPVRAEHHLSCTRLFALEYHTYHYLQDISCVTPEKLQDFAGLWYMQKKYNPHENTLLRLLDSLRIFFEYLRQENIISRDDYTNLTELCLNHDRFLKQLYEWKNQHPPIYNEPNGATVLPLSESNETALLEESLPSFKHQINQTTPTFRQMIYEWCNFPEPNSAKVISLDPSNKKQKKSGMDSLRTKESLAQHCQDILRGNVVFIRWLDRFGLEPDEIPPTIFDFCAQTEVWLEHLNRCIQNENLSRKDIKQGHEILDKIDRSLWNARQGIARQLNLDLRLLLL